MLDFPVLQLYDITGKLIAEQKLLDSVSNLSMAGLPIGNYIIRLNNQHANYSYRITKF